jgi:hypothetical protein
MAKEKEEKREKKKKKLRLSYRILLRGLFMMVYYMGFFFYVFFLIDAGHCYIQSRIRIYEVFALCFYEASSNEIVSSFSTDYQSKT